jgi:predicted NBD/HSP70 family sugar kinase
VTPAKPSLDLLRSLTDEHVLRALMSEERLTRAELSSRTRISKPTVSESVRRLAAAGLLRDTGARTSGRGRVGSYYALADTAGALVLSAGPEGIVAEVIDAHAIVRARATEPVHRPGHPGPVAAAITTAARSVRATAALPLRLAVVSAADPVDRRSGQLVHLPDAPFLIGDLSPVAALAGILDGPVLVDNDVNWAARAERAASPGPLDDFAYLHLGAGLGCAVVSDGEVRRGHSGLAGEIAQVLTRGPDGAAMGFIEVFGALGLRLPGATAIDVVALEQAVEGPGGDADVVLAVVATAVADVLSAIVATSDPELVLIGGDWGRHPRILSAIAAHVALLPRPVPILPALVRSEPALTGARLQALADLRSAIVELARPGGRPETGRSGTATSPQDDVAVQAFEV